MAADRIRQGFRALRPKLPVGYSAELQDVLTPAQHAAFQDMPVADQAHLLRVYHLLVAHGADDRDLLAAALLHDIGKVADNGHVRLPDRVACVLLGRWAPRLLCRLAQLPAPAWRRGLALAVHHAELGAAKAAELGCTPRTCWLIAHHDDPSAFADPKLAQLAAADHAAG